jgi:hypothetical protein
MSQIGNIFTMKSFKYLQEKEAHCLVQLQAFLSLERASWSHLLPNDSSEKSRVFRKNCYKMTCLRTSIFSMKKSFFRQGLVSVIYIR